MVGDSSPSLTYCGYISCLGMLAMGGKPIDTYRQMIGWTVKLMIPVRCRMCKRHLDSENGFLP
jgi:hypothetical protein